MGLRDIVRGGVATAKGVLGGSSGLLDTVVHQAWTGKDGYAKPTYDDSPGVSYEALVEYKRELDRVVGAEQIIQMAKITILEPIPDHGAAERQEPVDPRDKFILPDGRWGPILDVKGVSDPETGKPYMYEITLGENA